MIKRDDLITMKAIALCFKPFLKPEEALIYCNLGRTQFAKNCEEFGIYKNRAGYYKREELDKMLSGEQTPFVDAAKKLQAWINTDKKRRRTGSISVWNFVNLVTKMIVLPKKVNEKAPSRSKGLLIKNH